MGAANGAVTEGIYQAQHKYGYEKTLEVVILQSHSLWKMYYQH